MRTPRARSTTVPFAPISTRFAELIDRRRPGTRLVALAAVSAVLATLVASAALLGWWLGVDELASLIPGALPMRVNTAIALLLLGVGLLGRTRPAGSRWRRLAVAPVVAGLVLSAAVGSQYLTGLDLGIDQWLFREPPGAIGTAQPNRMSPMTIGSFLLLGVAILAADHPRAGKAVPVLLIGASLIGFLNVLDYIFAAAAPSLLAGYSKMSPGTAAMTVTLGIGAMGLLPDGGPLRVFSGSSSSAALARRLFAASVIAPTALAWLRLEGEARGLYEAHDGASLMVLGTVGFMAAVIWQSAWRQQRTERARVAARVELDRFFDMSSDMLATAGSDGRFTRLNPAWKDTLGYDLNELCARPFADFVHPDDREATALAVARQVEEGKSVFSFQNRYRHRDGSYRWLEWTSTPSADGSELFAVARDVTTRKLAEEEALAPLVAAREQRADAQRKLQETIRTRAFRPVFQPVYDLGSEEIVGFEALTRFDDGCRPDLVFAAALDCGLAIELEAVTLEAAIRASHELPARVWLSLNVSPSMLCDVQRLKPLVHGAGRPIVLEITEHEAIGAYEPLHAALVQLGPGIRLAVDDVGAGVANFNHLVELRADLIKIDAGLVRGVDHDLSRAALVVGLVHFAAAAGCKVIAEGVETAAERATVASLGVTLAQGYLLGRPAPVDTWSQRQMDLGSLQAKTRGHRRARSPSRV